jgi:hypothetical protein
MRIKTTKTVLLSGTGHRPTVAGTVVDAGGDQARINEFKALITAGYAKETKEAVGVPKRGNQRKLTDAAPAKRGDRAEAFDASAAHADDEFFNEVVSGTVGDVEANLADLDANGLARLEYLEGQREGGARKGALDAIGKARAALDGGEG